MLVRGQTPASDRVKSQKIQHSVLFEMIFVFILLLQLVQYNVQGKHYLVETEGEQDEPTMNRMSQVYDHKYDINEYKYDHMSTFYSVLDKTHTDKSLYTSWDRTDYKYNIL